MLSLKVKVSTGEATRMMDIIFRRAQDVKPVMRRWLGWLRSDAKRRGDEQPGWPGLAASTKDRLARTGTSKVTRFGRVRRSYARRSQSAYLGKIKRGGEDAALARSDLQALRRMVLEGAAAQVQGPQGVALTRLGRAMARAAWRRASGKLASIGKGRALGRHKRLLGRLPTSLLGEQSETGVSLESHAPWAGIHNEGGRAGNGALIPERAFLVIDERSAEMLAQIAQEHFLEGFVKEQGWSA